MQQIAKGIWKIPANSNVYYIEEINTLIDTGSYKNKELVKKGLKKINANVKNVIFTHLHYDHIGNFDLFLDAEFFASKESIDTFLKNPFGQVLDRNLVDKFKVKLNDVSFLELPSKYKIIFTPGHTSGSISIYDSSNKILFSGDTIFDNGVGRTDLPTSNETELIESINILNKLNVKILCPGHDT